MKNRSTCLGSIRIWAVLALVAAPASAFAEVEERSARNSIYVEGLGPGLAYSVNYDRMIIDDLAMRVGLSYMSYGASVSTTSGSSSSSVTYLTFPITASWVGVHSGKHALELGGGATLLYASGESSAMGVSASGSGMSAMGTAIVGYRLQPVDGGFQFRVGFSGLFGKGLGLDVRDPDAFGFLPWGYLSLGGTF